MLLFEKIGGVIILLFEWTTLILEVNVVERGVKVVDGIVVVLPLETCNRRLNYCVKELFWKSIVILLD